MATLIALIRGINVGGKNMLPMAELVSELKSIGLAQIRTYIQSGNVVFDVQDGQHADASKLASSISDLIFVRKQFRPHVIVLDAGELLNSVSKNPFKTVADEGEGKSLHIFFLEAVPLSVDKAGIDAVVSPNELWALQDKSFYLYSPDGFHKSKLAAKVEKLLGVPATARNWNSVRKICELVTSKIGKKSEY